GPGAETWVREPHDPSVACIEIHHGRVRLEAMGVQECFECGSIDALTWIDRGAFVGHQMLVGVATDLRREVGYVEECWWLRACNVRHTILAHLGDGCCVSLTER